MSEPMDLTDKGRYKALLAANPRDVALNERLAILLRNFGCLNESVEQMRKTLEMDPLEARHYRHLAEILLLKCQAQRAGDLCQSALKLFPESHHFYRILADSYLIEVISRTLDGEAKRQNLYVAEETLKKGFHLNALDAQLCAIQAKLCLMQNDETEATDYLQWALESGLPFLGDQIEVLLCIGIIHSRQGIVKGLGESIQKGLALFSEWTMPHYLRLSGLREHLLLMGEMYLNKPIKPKPLKAVFDDYDKLIAQGVQDSPGSRIFRESILGMVQKRAAGDIEGAVKELRHVVEHFDSPPHCVFYHFLKKTSLETILNVIIGDLFLKKGKKRKAMIYYQKALKVSPRDPAARSRMEEM
jgi:tetratricopeptide (TPR) repeat protein